MAKSLMMSSSILFNKLSSHLFSNNPMILPPLLSYEKNDKFKIPLDTDNATISELEKTSFGEFMFTLDNFLSPEECRKWIAFSDNYGFTPVFHKASRIYAHRDVGEIVIEDPDVANLIFMKLRPYLPNVLDGLEPTGCSTNIRLYQYTVDQKFGKHIDVTNDDPHGRGHTLYTILVYLNGQKPTSVKSSSSSSSDTSSDVQSDTHSLNKKIPYMKGGETLFYKEQRIKKKKNKNVDEGEVLWQTITPVSGKLLAHAHGDRCLTHEGCVVTEGVKYVLRTDVVYGRL